VAGECPGSSNAVAILVDAYFVARGLLYSISEKSRIRSKIDNLCLIYVRQGIRQLSLSKLRLFEYLILYGTRYLTNNFRCVPANHAHHELGDGGIFWQDHVQSTSNGEEALATRPIKLLGVSLYLPFDVGGRSRLDL
jgi:hypothetical protein